ncbi:MAG: caspase domain-containing protein, partial [Pseudomonadota bacterium]
MSAAKMLMLKLIIALSFAASMAMAVGDRRVALVIGNADYWNFPDLANPGNDAADLGARLEDLGFEVILGVDQTRDELVSTLLDFARRLEGADTSLFFFAGHGMQINDVNHMIPVDAILSPELRVDDQTVTIDRVVQLMNQFTDNALVFLDACRDNPLTADIPIGSRDDGVGRGLARLRAAGGSYISFATAPGHVAYDGEGRNSPFTEALLRHISTPNVDIRLMMADVRRDVFEATAQQQLPWENNSLIGRFYFRQDDRLSR